MAHDEEIEMLLWDFIDGNCTSTEQLRIKTLIDTDNAWKQKYHELTNLHQSIHTDLEEPSMRFSKNVMDAISQTHIAPASKKYINRYIIRGIAAFFVLTLAIVLVYASSSAHWTDPATTNQFNASQLHIEHLLNSNVIYVFILINIVVGLLLIDTLLRKKKLQEY